MDHDHPHYRAYGYMSDRLSFEFTESAIDKSKADMIAKLREYITPDPEATLDLGIYADLFHCRDKQVTLLGTWVLSHNGAGDFETVWYASGWIDRPAPSKEKALRYLQQLGRPA